MSRYKVCKICGNVLDFGESCEDCKEKTTMAGGTAHNGTQKITDLIIAQRIKRSKPLKEDKNV